MDEIERIEQQHGAVGLGRMGYRIYKGARDEGATRWDACLVACAWYTSLTAPTALEDNTDKDEDGE